MPDDPSKEQQTQQPDLSALMDPTTGLILGKYKTAAEAIKGVKEAGNSLAAERKRADEMAHTLKSYEETLAALKNPQAAQSEADPLAELRDVYGIPVEALDKRFAALASQTWEQKQNELLAPIMSMATVGAARSLVAEKYPDYTKHEGDILKFIDENPDVKEAYDEAAKTKNPKLVAVALENGRLRWLESGAGERASVADTDETKAAKAAMSLPGGGGGGRSRSAALSEGDREKELQDARAKYMQDRDDAAFAAVFNKGKPRTWNDWLTAKPNQG